MKRDSVSNIDAATKAEMPAWQVRCVLGSLFLLILYAVIFLRDASLLSAGPDQLKHAYNLWWGSFTALMGLLALAVNCGPGTPFVRWSVGVFIAAQLSFGFLIGMLLVTPIGILNAQTYWGLVALVITVMLAGLAYARIWPWGIVRSNTLDLSNSAQHSVGQLMFIVGMAAIIAAQATWFSRQNLGEGLSSWQSVIVSALFVFLIYAVAFMPAIWLAAVFLLGAPTQANIAFQFLASFVGIQALAFIAAPVIAGYNQLIAVQSFVSGLGFYITLAFTLSIARLLGFRMVRTNWQDLRRGTTTSHIKNWLSPNLRFAIAMSLIALAFTATLSPALRIHEAREQLRDELYKASP